MASERRSLGKPLLFLLLPDNLPPHPQTTDVSLRWKINRRDLQPGDLCKLDGIWAQRLPSGAHILTTAPSSSSQNTVKLHLDLLPEGVCMFHE